MDEPTRETRSAAAPTGRVAVREVEAQAVSPEAFLRTFGGLPRGFWEREGRWAAWAGQVARAALPRGGGELAGRLTRWRRSLGPEATGRCYGGAAFDPAAPPVAGPEGARAELSGGPAGWRRWPAALFVLPAVELRRDERGFGLTVRVRLPEGSGADAADRAARRTAERVRRRLEETSGAPEPGMPTAEAVRRTPGRQGWTRLVEAALAAVRDGSLEKVVPARLLELTLSEPPAPVALLARLRGGDRGTFPFLVEPTPGTVLVGAAPELVASRRGERFLATAVAGTAAEGEDEEETERLARRLLESAKDRAEHQLTVRDMREALVSVAGVARVDREPEVLRLRGMQHLLTRLTARLPDRPHVLELLDALHPTAAVNGLPRDGARAFLRAEEPFDRGWFAGPVGWFDQAGDGTFAPALRCALLEGRTARLFAGAGIVEGSRPDDEWRETAMKLRPVLRALGLEGAGLAGDGEEGAGIGADSGGGAPPEAAT